jgi:hypothetical protein
MSNMSEFDNTPLRGVNESPLSIIPNTVTLVIGVVILIVAFISLVGSLSAR